MTQQNSNARPKIERSARLRWVPLNQMRVNTLAQREIVQARVDHLAANLDLDQIGNPVVSHRDGHFWVIDGQHRIEAMRQFGFTTETIQCWVHEGLTSEDEAERFLKLNDTLVVQAIPKYRAAVHAGRDVETDIDRVVRSLGLSITRDKIPGAIGAVGTVRRAYSRGGAKTLARSLTIIRDAYGDAGFEAAVIDGVSHVCARYNGELDDKTAIERLSKAHGGVSGLINKAEVLRRQTGNAKGHCVAAAVVDTINTGRGRGKLPSWWKS